MPVARYKMPDGRIGRFNVPEGTTPEEAQALIAAKVSKMPVGGDNAPAPEKPEPSFYDQLRDGLFAAGSNLADAATDVFTDPMATVRNASGVIANEIPGKPMPPNPELALMESVGAANRAGMGAIDFIPEGINAGLRVAGVDAQIPTVEGMVGKYGVGQGDYLPPGLARDSFQAAGALSIPAGGFQQVAGRNLASFGGAASELLGIGTAASGTQVAKTVSGFAEDTSKTAKQIAEIKAGTNPTGNAASKIVTSVGGFEGIAKDRLAHATSWQGFDEGLVGMIKGSSKKTRENMLKMLKVVEESKKNYKFAAENTPLQIMGDSVLDRVKVLWQANRSAGNRLDGVADGLKGQVVDVNPAVQKFLDDLKKMGMEYDPTTRKLNLIEGSKTQDMPKVHKEAMRILSRMHKWREGSEFDAFDVHELKGWLDNNLDYAKSGKGGKNGMIKALERSIKGLRHDLDGILDGNFPEYNDVNTQYAETISALQQMSDVAGSNIDLTSKNAFKALGTLSRRILSNYSSAEKLKDTLELVDTTAKKYAGTSTGRGLVPYKEGLKSAGVEIPDLSDDFVEQVQFAANLDKIFGTNKANSLAGLTETAITRAGSAATGGMSSALVDAGLSAKNKLMRINDERGIQAMADLLRNIE